MTAALVVETNVRNYLCDVDLATERRSNPHVLVATKNRATYERRAAQRREDLTREAALAG